MSENQEAYPPVLTDAEREALERPGLKQRARAISAVTELATRIGLGEDITALVIERLRTLEGGEAKLAWRAFGDTSEVLAMLDIDMREVVGDEAVPGESTVAQEVSPGESDAEQKPSEEKKDWFEGRHFDLRSVREFYKSIDRKTEGEWVTIPESIEKVDADEIIGLLALYAANHTKPKVAAKQIDYLREGMVVDGVTEGSYGGGVRYAATGRIGELLDSQEPGIRDEKREPTELRVETSEEKVLDVAIALDNLIELEGEESTYNIERVERVLDQLRREGVDIGLTAEDFTHDVMKQLADIYSKTSTSAEEMITTNIACTWGWLSNVDMEELVHMRRSIKPDAGAADVHNSKAAFVNGVIRAWRKGHRLELSEGESLEHEPLHSVPSIEVEAEDATDAAEQSVMDEEPKHVQVVDAYVEQLGLTVNKRAFEELLNPVTRGEMTEAKKIVIESLRHRVGTVSPSGEILNELMVKARGKSSLRRFLGLGFMKHGKPEERAPEALKEQLRNMPQLDHTGYAKDLYDALEALLGVLVAAQQEQDKKEAEPKPLQVVFGANGEAQLA